MSVGPRLLWAPGPSAARDAQEGRVNLRSLEARGSPNCRLTGLMVNVLACLLMARRPQVPVRIDFAEEIRLVFRRSLPPL